MQDFKHLYKKDFKHLYNAEPKISAWTMLKEGLSFVLALFAMFAVLLALSI